MIDHYAEALLVTVIGASLYLRRGGTTRGALALILAMSILWWSVMVGLRVISETPLGWRLV